MPSANTLLNEFRGLVSAFSSIRGVVIAAILTIALLALPAQSFEIYRAIAQDWIHNAELARTGNSKAQFQTEVFVAVAGTLLNSLIFWFTTRELLSAFASRPRSKTESGRFIIRFAPAIMSALPFFAIAAGLYRGRVKDVDADVAALAIIESLQRMNVGVSPEILGGIAKKFTQSMISSNDLLLQASVLALVAGAVLLVMALIYERWSPVKASSGDSILASGLSYGLSYLVIIAAIVAVIVSPVALPVAAGPLGIAFLFLICIALGLARLTYLSDKYDVPAMSVLIVVALIASGLSLNDNDGIRLVEPDPTAKDTKQALDFNEAFYDWLEARPDKDAYIENMIPYPVYIVAAQGGGIYAAFHSAILLGALQDDCSNFASHVLAISGVSGGSVGSSVFAALVNAEPPLEPARCVKREGGFSYAEAPERLLDRDLLAPIFAGLFFPDFMQNFLPFSVPPFDRARALEATLETYWSDLIASYRITDPDFGQSRADNVFAGPFAELWNPHGNTPALLLNTTEVDTGQKRVISPFRLDEGFATLPPRTASRIRLSTAAVLSARFPWVTPSGWFEEPGGNRIRLTDGGFFDNSGTATAMALVRRIRSLARSDKGLPYPISIRLIALTATAEAEPPSAGFDELIGPVRALLNSTSSRSLTILEDARLSIGNLEQLPTMTTGISILGLGEKGYELPLGWRLSVLTRSLIQGQLGSAEKCESVAREMSINTSIDCFRKIIVEELSVADDQ